LTETQQRHIRQLPFIGKHSVPPKIRTDVWKPFCTVSFPSPAQGLHAFRKLREFRKLHELRWDHHNPEWKKLKVEAPKKLIRNIMNQRANSVADLAQVLSIQGEQGAKMVEETERRTKLQREFLDPKWAEIEELARLAEGGEIPKLEREIKSITNNPLAKEGEESRKPVDSQVKTRRQRIKQLLWAQQMVKARNEASTTPVVHEALVGKKNAKTSATQSNRLSPRDMIEQSILPKHLKSCPEPFTLDGVEIQWADLQDAEFAENWPTEIEHDYMGILNRDPLLPGQGRRRFPVTEDEWDAEQAELLRQARAKRYPDEVVEEAPKSTMDRIKNRLKMFPNPFRQTQIA